MFKRRGPAALLRILYTSCLILNLTPNLFAMTRQANIENTTTGMTNGLTRVVLDNGLIVLIKEDTSAPLISAQIWVGTGSADEQEYFGGGLSHWMEHMIFKGTPTQLPGAIAKTIGDLGGNINAYTSLDRTVFLVDAPAPRWRTALEVLADALQNASFPENEWQREKQVIQREMAMGEDSPDRRISRLLWETAYRVHPYRAPIIGYPDVFNTLTRDDLLIFFRRNYRPDNMILALAGDIRAAEAESAIRELFGARQRRAHAPALLPAEPEQIAERSARHAGPYAATRVAVCWHTVALSDPDAPDLDLLATITGNGRSSRLTRAIKDKLKLAHTISAWSFTPRDKGLFGISAVCDPGLESALMQAIYDEAQSWTREPFAAAEIEKARRMILLDTISSFQTVQGQAYSFASGEFYTGSPVFFQTYLQRLEKVTPESVMAVARKYLRTENRTTAILAPESTNSAATASPAPLPASKVEKITLTNGIPVLLRENHKLPMVWICAACSGGLLLENETNNGITSMMAELMLRGAGGHSADAIAQTVESLGASLAAYCSRNSFGLRAQCLSGDVPVLLEIMADCLVAPAFAPDELAKLKPIQVSIIQQQRESPLFVAQEGLRQALFPGHPYRFLPEGSPLAVEAVTVKDLRAWHAGLVVDQNLVLAIFGDIAPAQAHTLAERYFKNVPTGPRPQAACAKPHPVLPQCVHRMEPREQAVFMAGFPGIDLFDPRNDALSILQQALTGLSSDLFVSIRDKKGLAYYTGAIQQPAVMPGLFAIYVGTRASALPEVQDLVRQEILRVAGEGIRADEFERARRKLITDQAQRLQQNGELAQECALNELYGRGWAYSLETENRLQNVTLQAIRDAAASILHTNQMVISIVEPEKDKTE